MPHGNGRSFSVHRHTRFTQGRNVMFNHFAFLILERLSGRKLAVSFSEFSGTSERTWRARFKHGWIPTEEDRINLGERTKAAHTKQLVDIGGWLPDEASAILAEYPSARTGKFLPTADLIYRLSPNHGKYCQETLALAEHFDQECAALSDAIALQDAAQVRDVLITMLDWLQSFCLEELDIDEARVLRAQLKLDSDVDSLLETAKPLSDALLFHVLSCWDVEFCAGYFGNTMQAYPLFQLVMPRFNPSIDFDLETGRLSKNGKQAKKGVFNTATSRLFDFLFVLAAWRRDRRLPENMPRVKNFSAWSGESEARLVSWRDETTRFTIRQLECLWTTVIKPDSDGIYPSIPFPMFFCSHLWSPLLTREKGRPTILLDCTESYGDWWKRNRHRLVAKGLQFGMQAWPAYLTSQGAEGKSFASFCASLPSGCPSSPPDDQ